MDYMKDNKEISAEEAVILWQASRLSLSKSYEKAPEILKVHGSVIGTLGNFSASIGKAKSKKTFNVSAIVAAALRNGTVLRYVAEHITKLLKNVEIQLQLMLYTAGIVGRQFL